MEYEQWLEQLEQNGKALREKKDLLTKAAARCSKKTQEDLKDFLDNLDLMFSTEAVPEGMDLFLEQEKSLTKEDFKRIKLGSEIVELAANLKPPMEFLSQKGVRGALLDIMKASGAANEMYTKPNLAESPGLREMAYRASPINLAAQYMALRRIPSEGAAAEEFINALSTVPRWEKEALLKKTMQNEAAADAIRNGDTKQFDAFYKTVQQEELSKTRSFREWSDEIAKRYRNRDITYAQLELEMSALRALAPGKNDNEREQQQISIGNFRSKVAELKKQKTGEIDPEAYQKQLADSYIDDADLSVECLDDIYGMNPRFHPELVNPNASDPTLGYTESNMKNYMPPFNMDVKVGGKSVSNREFASLASLAIYDLNIGGSYVFRNVLSAREPVTIEPNLWVAANNHSMYVMNCANSYVTINGKRRAAPDNRIDIFIRTASPAARYKTKEVLEAYQRGDVAPLAKLIAHGLNLAVNYGKHHINHETETADWKDRSLLNQLNTDGRGNDLMLQGALDLLDRDPNLKKAVQEAGKEMGLKEEDIAAARAFKLGQQVHKAGQAAMQRLSEDASGQRKLSGPEKEQCVLAIQRMKAMVQNIDETEQAAAEHPKYLEFMEKYEAMEQELTENEMIGKNKPDYFKTEEGTRAFQPWVSESAVKMYMYGGLPAVYREMAKGGIAALDARITTQDCRAARNMTSRQIIDGFQTANGIFKKEIKEIKTTAKDIYDLLTKQYKAGELNYTLYEARLRAMRELTGGNPKARIDLPTIDMAVENRIEEEKNKQKEKLDPVESRIVDMLETDQTKMNERVRHVDDVWRITPRLNKDALPGAKTPLGGYTMKQFELLEAFKEGPGENYLHLNASEKLSEEEFAVLGIAASQAYPEIGAVYFEKQDENGFGHNLITDPENHARHLATWRTPYFSDLDQGFGKPRDKAGGFFNVVIVPARQKVVEALRSFQAGSGSQKELVKIMGLGLHRLVEGTTVANDSYDKVHPEMKRDSLMECAYIGRLAEFLERKPALMNEAIKEKYMTQEDLEKAKGLGLLFKFVAGADLAQKKLEDSAAGKTQLTPDERKACVELMLRRKVLRESALRQAKENRTDEKVEEAALIYGKMDMSTPENRAIAFAELDVLTREAIGQPDYLRPLGAKGEDYAREMLDRVMTNRDAFLEKSDVEILKMITATPLSKDDPFTHPEYQPKPVDACNEMDALEKSRQESRRAMSAPQPGGKTL